MPSDRARIASSVRAELARVGISGRTLADRLGWSRDATARRLRGAVPFGADELVVIARELGVPASVFVESLPSPEPVSPAPRAGVA